MFSIYTYDNYREYLREFLELKKSQNSNFSHRYFTQKAGLSSHSYINLILKGKRNLNEITIAKMITGLGLKGKQAEYFKNMVYFEQSVDLDNKEEYYWNMNILRSNSKFFKLNKTHYKYFKDWYNPVIRNLAVYADWQGDYKLLAKMLNPSITAKKAKESVELLLDIGLIKKTGEHYGHTNEHVDSSSIPTFIKEKSRLDMLEKGTESTVRFTASERLTSYYTFAMGKEDYQTMIEKVDEFIDDITTFVANTKQTERVYEFIIQLFPLSNTFKMKEK